MLQAEIERLHDTWANPDEFSLVAAERDNARSQLAVVKTARNDLQEEVKLLRHDVAATRERQRQDHDTLQQLEIELERLVPTEFLGEQWDNLGDPTRRYIEHLQQQARVPQTGEAPPDDSLSVTVPFQIEVLVPLQVKVVPSGS
ncbi:hypothetical protein LCGC14_0823600 [marine sediment metagenome]|uniref:Uncharacterized protein n=1 Tax=marine sediment metagenome TaxID=412755 RepID=A0A0F9Q3C2_9ZZZZ